MNTTQRNPQHTRLLGALTAEQSSIRLQAALALGTEPEAAFAHALLERCAIEPDFFVRDMLTWALTRLPAQVTVPKLRAELASARPQARSQALHTLSKIGDPDSWPAITPALLRDADDEVARAAWRAAVVLVPDAERDTLAAALATQLGRGDRETWLSLSRALVALGAELEPVLEQALAAPDPAVRAHATATRELLLDPDGGAGFAVDAARRAVALGPKWEEKPRC
ncbi:HEAT repeat domain-containing protein [Nocardia sp. NPDC048505]|uniref:HEAT repeat domain-containing protein n=1 Tax=unclassified Nocardia TaxID=2637762 RepID=UPI0033CD59DA